MNVAVEHKAMLHSQADWIVYWIDGQEQLLIIRRIQLLKFLELNWKKNPHPYKVLRGGQFNDWMTLFPVNVFVRMCDLL